MWQEMTCDNAPSWSKKTGRANREKNDHALSEDRILEHFYPFGSPSPWSLREAKDTIGIICSHWKVRQRKVCPKSPSGFELKTDVDVSTPSSVPFPPSLYNLL